MTRTLLLACSSAKNAELVRGPASEVYAGRLFRLGLTYAERVGMPVLILSAKYGFITPETIIEPYDDFMRRTYQGPWPDLPEAVYLGGSKYFGKAPKHFTSLVFNDRGYEDMVYHVRELLKKTY